MIDRLAPWILENFWLFWFLNLGWVVLVFGLNARGRLARGLPVFRPRLPGSLFEENWRSGGRGLFGANNCAWVTLLPGRLLTGMHFPFNLAFPRRLLLWAGLDNEMAVADIVSLEEQRFFGRRRLRITYRTTSGEAFVWLDLRRPEALREAIAVARRGA